MIHWQYCGGQVLIFLVYLGGPALLFFSGCEVCDDNPSDGTAGESELPIFLTLGLLLLFVSHLISAGVIK